jgi:hypothetical protein
MPDGVHAAMDGMEKAARNAVLDRPDPEPQRDELLTRDNTMLPSGELGDRPIGPRLQLPMYLKGNCSLDGHAPMKAIHSRRIETRTAPRLRKERHNQRASLPRCGRKRKTREKRGPRAPIPTDEAHAAAHIAPR